DIKSVINQKHSQIGVKKVDDPRSFGVAELNQKDIVSQVVEKPLIPKSNMAMVGIYYITNTKSMYQSLDKHLAGEAIANDGEYHLTNALQFMIEEGVVFEAFRVINWFDCGKKDNVLETNALLLKERENEPIRTDHFQQNNAVIIPPVSIANGCVINNSIIGPNATIGEHTVINASIIKDSIIGSYAKM